MASLTTEVILPVYQGKPLSAVKVTTEFKLDVHGETYEVAVTGKSACANKLAY